MRVIRNIAATGRSVVCTIHQPSTEIFLFFDQLLLLKRGGEEVYFGPVGHEGGDMVEFFEGVPGVNRKPKRLNPASWMLEVISEGNPENSATMANRGRSKSREASADADGKAGPKDLIAAATIDIGEATGESSGKLENAVDHFLDVTARIGTAKESDFAPYYQEHELFARNSSEVERSLQTPSDPKASPEALKQAATATKPTVFVQLRAVLGRHFTTYWRNVQYNFVRIVVTAVMALLFGLIFRDVSSVAVYPSAWTLIRCGVPFPTAQPPGSS